MVKLLIYEVDELKVKKNNCSELELSNSKRHEMYFIVCFNCLWFAKMMSNDELCKLGIQPDMRYLYSCKCYARKLSLELSSPHCTIAIVCH